MMMREFSEYRKIIIHISFVSTIIYLSNEGDNNTIRIRRKKPGSWHNLLRTLSAKMPATMICLSQYLTNGSIYTEKNCFRFFKRILNKDPYPGIQSRMIRLNLNPDPKLCFCLSCTCLVCCKGHTIN